MMIVIGAVIIVASLMACIILPWFASTF